MLGAFSLGWVGVGHHGTDSQTVGPIVSSKCSYCFTAPPSTTVHARSPHGDVDRDARWTIAETTSRSGHDAGPRTEIATADAAFPRCAASSTSVPRANSARKTPECVSPAPFVSTTVVSKAATRTGTAFFTSTVQPLAPWRTTTPRLPVALASAK